MTLPPLWPPRPAAVAYPILGRRYAAATVDGLVVLGGMLLLGELLGDAPDALKPLRSALFFALLIGYEPGCTAFGTTLGQRLFRFRVRRAVEPTERISLGAPWVRYVVKLVLGLVSFLTMGFNPQRRALHDLACGSVVLDVDALPG